MVTMLLAICIVLWSTTLPITSVIKGPVTFFLSHTTHEADLFLTDITFSDSIIIEAIKELPPKSSLLLF